MLDETNLFQRLGAEALGTAFLVFIGVGSVPATLIVNGDAPFTMADLGMISLAFGTIVVATVYALGHIGGNGWMFPWGQHALLPGHDDGAVAHHSAGGYVNAGSYSSLCSSGRWTNHQTWWSCEYGSLDHTELKMKGICNDGGASGCP